MSMSLMSMIKVVSFTEQAFRRTDYGKGGGRWDAARYPGRMYNMPCSV